MPEKILTLPPVRKKYFEHGLAHTKASKAALKTLAVSLVAIRKGMGITQQEFASRVGISRNTLNHVENAENFPSMAVYLAICRELKLEKPPLT